MSCAIDGDYSTLYIYDGPSFVVLPRSPTVILWFFGYWYLSFSICYIHELIL